MPWHWKPKKDAASCDNPRGGARARRSAGLRMGEPGARGARRPPAEHIRRRGATRGTETSKYPEEEKSTEIPPVVASERGTGQTGGSESPAGVVGAPVARDKASGERNGLGRPAVQG